MLLHGVHEGTAEAYGVGDVGEALFGTARAYDDDSAIAEDSSPDGLVDIDGLDMRYGHLEDVA